MLRQLIAERGYELPALVTTDSDPVALLRASTRFVRLVRDTGAVAQLLAVIRS
jgi:hypothetical protein